MKLETLADLLRKVHTADQPAQRLAQRVLSMGVRYPFVFGIATNNLALSQNVEQICVSTPPFSPSVDLAAVLLFFYVEIAWGAGVTGCQFRLRRGAAVAGSTLVNASAFTSITASTNTSTCLVFADSAPAVAGQVYIGTATGTGMTANGTINEAFIAALSL